MLVKKLDAKMEEMNVRVGDMEKNANKTI